MIRLMHLADLHLGWQPKKFTEEKNRIRKNERDQLLQKAVDVALSPKNNIHGVIIAGDLFETYNPEDALVRSTLQQLSRITSSGRMLVTVPGNHDEITYGESIYRTMEQKWPGTLVTSPMPRHCLSAKIQDTSVFIYSLAYTGGLTKPALIDTFPKKNEEGFHIGAFHGSLDWAGLPDRSLPLTSAKLAEAGYHYIALGHYHGFSEKNIGVGKAVYPGAVEYKSFNDGGTGFFTVVCYDGRSVSLVKIPVDVRPHEKIEIDVSMMKDKDELMEYCRSKSDPEKVLQLSFVGTPPFMINEENLSNELESSFFHVEVNNAIRFFSDGYLDTISNELTVRGFFVKRMREKILGMTDPRERKIHEMALLKGLEALEGGDGE